LHLDVFEQLAQVAEKRPPAALRSEGRLMPGVPKTDIDKAGLLDVS
jgi:hypothetical protein